MSHELKLTDHQKAALAVPEDHDLFAGGGRGGGKSWLLALLALRHGETYGERSRILYLRRTLPGCEDFVGICREIFGLAYGSDWSYNKANHIFTLPTGAYFEIGPLAGGIA